MLTSIFQDFISLNHMVEGVYQRTDAGGPTSSRDEGRVSRAHPRQTECYTVI